MSGVCCVIMCLRYHAQLNAERAELERVHTDRLARLAAREEEVRSAARQLLAAGSITPFLCSNYCIILQAA
jgi:hypothetical protein